MKLTWFDANSWLIEAGGQRVLIDPWLVGDLVFAGAPWLVRGRRSQNIPIPQNIDVILLSQGLADHAHPETLKQLNKSIPVIASPEGAKVAKDCLFESVTALKHGQTVRIGLQPPDSNELPNQPPNQSGLEIQAFMGAVVGPFKRENAYVLSFLSAGHRLYYEPHGYPDVEHLKAIGPVEVVISPMVNQTLMGVAPVIRGHIAAPQLAELLTPQVMLPTAEAGMVRYDGLIAPTLTSKGGADEMRSRFLSEGKNIRIIQPVSGETLSLDLQDLQTPAAAN
jgi:L-ascorbate metabolism protein UlaG (beta-lactamase superfamily)